MISYYFSQTQLFLEKSLVLIQTFAASPCGSGRGGSFFGFPTWYKYLDGRRSVSNGQSICTPVLSGINEFWLIGLAAIEILLRVIILLAIFYTLFGGLKYITARGNPESIEAAKNTVLDAIKGVMIAVAATAIVAYIGSRFTQ